MFFGALLTFVTNFMNIMEVNELAGSRKNYDAYQGLLMSILSGLVFAIVASFFIRSGFRFEWIMLLHTFVWLFKVLITFAMAQRINPVVYQVIKGVLLPLTIILDILFGFIEVNGLMLFGVIIIFSSVITSIYRDKRIKIKNLNDFKMTLIAVFGLLLSAYLKVLRYDIRVNYDYDTISFMLTNSSMGIVILFVVMIILKKFKPRNIIKHRESHMRACSYSVVQQVLGIMVLGYIPATYVVLLTQVFSYLSIPISRRSKDGMIRIFDNKSYVYFIMNFVGTALIVAFS